MPIELNHTIVWCANKERSAAFYADMLGRPAPRSFGPFLVVDLDNGVSLDFSDDGDIAKQHYAFLVDDATFDAVFARVEAQALPYWADPAKRQAQQLYRHYGGRGCYFDDPDGHLLEVMTRPYPK